MDCKRGLSEAQPRHWGHWIGDWKNEVPKGCEVTRYFSAGPKCWALEIKDPTGQKRWESKCKGIKLTTKSQEDLPIETMFEAVMELDNSPKIVTDPMKIRKDRNRGVVYSKQEVKKWQINVTKRGVLPCGRKNSSFWLLWPGINYRVLFFR